MAATDTLIIDEVSMTPAEMLEKVDEIFRACAESSGKDKPFGGKNVLLFGDLYQLPSVQMCDTETRVQLSTLVKVHPFQPYAKLSSGRCSFHRNAQKNSERGYNRRQYLTT